MPPHTANITNFRAAVAAPAEVDGLDIFHAAIAAADGSNIVIDNADAGGDAASAAAINIVYLPHNPANITAAAPFSVSSNVEVKITNLGNTIMEEGSAVMRKLFPTKDPEPHTVYITLVVASVILAAATATAVAALSKATQIQQ